MKPEKRSPFESSDPQHPQDTEQTTLGTSQRTRKGFRFPFKLRIFLGICGTVVALAVVAIMGSLDANPIAIGVVAGATGAIALISGWFVAQSFSDSVTKTTALANSISQGDLTQTIDIESNDEIGDMADALENMITYLQSLAQAAEKVAAGDLSIALRPKSQQDSLGQAFFRMVDSLRPSFWTMPDR